MRSLTTKLAKVELESLWADYVETRDERIRNRLMEHYLPVVSFNARRMAANLSDEVDVEDLFSAGTFGLIGAIETFDPSRGFKFETYCGPRVRGAMLDELRSLDWAPRLVRRRARRWNDAMDNLTVRLGRLPDDNEMRRELDVDRREFTKISRDAQTMSWTSLNRKQGEEAGGEEIFIIDVLEANHDCSPDQRAISEEIKELITSDLSRPERMLVLLYYFEEMTMREIGEVLQLSESRVSQMHSSILERLQRKFGRVGDPQAA
jgi:RNA polymerase sigma factor for flagellar operon FliA